MAAISEAVTLLKALRKEVGPEIRRIYPKIGPESARIHPGAPLDHSESLKMTQNRVKSPQHCPKATLGVSKETPESPEMAPK